ncbi:MAG TPA: hypothetical protein VIP46_13210 [Pyrinomonadaceae bacterium]
MKTVAGIFHTRADAERAIESLRSQGVADERLNLLTQGSSAEDLADAIPTTETEQPGMGQAMGTAVGGALGVAGGAHLGAVIATSLIPGVGPVLAIGMIGAALLGTGGVLAGRAAGEALEDNIAPELPHDELYIYEDALRQGRTVIICAAEDDGQAASVRAAFDAAGAESVDAARDTWWLGLRDAEAETYAAGGADFGEAEPYYRRGFESALHPRARGKSYEEDLERLRECYGDECDTHAFRTGYGRGRAYHQKFGGGEGS